MSGFLYRLPGPNSGRSFAQQIPEGVLDVTEQRSSKRLQQEAEGYVEPDFFIGHVHLTIDATAMKVQRIAMPFAAEVVFIGKPLGRFLRQRSCLRDR